MIESTMREDRIGRKGGGGGGGGVESYANKVRPTTLVLLITRFVYNSSFEVELIFFK